MQNLVIGDNLEITAHDLQSVISHHGVQYVIDFTTKYHGVNIEKLKLLSDRLKVRILYGYTPQHNHLNCVLAIDNLEEKLRNELEFTMKNGTMKTLPSFIGELIIKDFESQYEQTVLSVCYEY